MKHQAVDNTWYLGLKLADLVAMSCTWELYHERGRREICVYYLSMARCWLFLATHSLGSSKEQRGRSGRPPGVMSCYFTVSKRHLCTGVIRNLRTYALIKGGREFKAIQLTGSLPSLSPSSLHPPWCWLRERNVSVCQQLWRSASHSYSFVFLLVTFLPHLSSSSFHDAGWLRASLCY